MWQLDTLKSKICEIDLKKLNSTWVYFSWTIIGLDHYTIDCSDVLEFVLGFSSEANGLA